MVCDREGDEVAKGMTSRKKWRKIEGVRILVTWREIFHNTKKVPAYRQNTRPRQPLLATRHVYYADLGTLGMEIAYFARQPRAPFIVPSNQSCV